jgi:transcription termination factor NusB
MNVTHKLELKRIYGVLEQLKEDAQKVHDELEEEFEDKSDKWKESDAGETAQAEIDNLEALIDGIENAYDNISEYIR